MKAIQGLRNQGLESWQTGKWVKAYVAFKIEGVKWGTEASNRMTFAIHQELCKHRATFKSEAHDQDDRTTMSCLCLQNCRKTRTTAWNRFLQVGETRSRLYQHIRIVCTESKNKERKKKEKEGAIYLYNSKWPFLSLQGSWVHWADPLAAHPWAIYKLDQHSCHSHRSCPARLNTSWPARMKQANFPERVGLFILFLWCTENAIEQVQMCM